MKPDENPDDSRTLRIRAMEFTVASQVDMSRGIAPPVSDLLKHAEKIFKWLSSGAGVE